MLSTKGWGVINLSLIKRAARVTHRARREDDDARLALLEERLEQRDQEEVALRLWTGAFLARPGTVVHAPAPHALQGRVCGDGVGVRER